MTWKNNRAPLLSYIKHHASFHHHMWIQTGIRIRKRLSWVLTSVTLTFDLWPWPWPFAWTSLLSLVITPENFECSRHNMVTNGIQPRPNFYIRSNIWKHDTLIEYTSEYISSFATYFHNSLESPNSLRYFPFYFRHYCIGMLVYKQTQDYTPLLVIMIHFMCVRSFATQHLSLSHALAQRPERYVQYIISTGSGYG